MYALRFFGAATSQRLSHIGHTGCHAELLITLILECIPLSTSGALKRGNICKLRQSRRKVAGHTHHVANEKS